MTIMDIPTHKLVCKDCNKETEFANLISFNSFTPLPEGYAYNNECPKCGSGNTQKVLIEGRTEMLF
jgi:hypothetical protein